MKITKRMLRDYRKNKKEIPILEMELEELLTTTVGLGNVIDYRTGYPRSQTIIGVDEELYVKRQKALEQKKEEIKSVEAWIESIPDGQARYVFKMFYMQGMGWGKIAGKIGYKGNPDYVRIKIRDKCLKEYCIN